jgi:hypothetical protein
MEGSAGQPAGGSGGPATQAHTPASEQAHKQASHNIHRMPLTRTQASPNKRTHTAAPMRTYPAHRAHRRSARAPPDSQPDANGELHEAVPYGRFDRAAGRRERRASDNSAHARPPATHTGAAPTRPAQPPESARIRQKDAQMQSRSPGEVTRRPAGQRATRQLGTHGRTLQSTLAIGRRTAALSPISKRTT